LTFTAPWWVLSNQRFASEAILCTPGSRLPMFSPRALAARWLRRSWV
jgi:hypothetical protein